MFSKYYNHVTLSTPLPTHMSNSSAKSKSICQTSLSKLNNHFWKVQVKWIIWRAKPIPNIPHIQNYCDGDKLSCSRILGDGDFQLTENWSAKILVEESQKCNILFPISSGKKFPEKSVQKILEHLADL